MEASINKKETNECCSEDVPPAALLIDIKCHDCLPDDATDRVVLVISLLVSETCTEIKAAAS
jgi:hypothetical protein